MCAATQYCVTGNVRRNAPVGMLLPSGDAGHCMIASRKQTSGTRPQCRFECCCTQVAIIVFTSNDYAHCLPVFKQPGAKIRPGGFPWLMPFYKAPAPLDVFRPECQQKHARFMTLTTTSKSSLPVATWMPQSQCSCRLAFQLPEGQPRCHENVVNVIGAGNWICTLHVGVGHL